MVMNLVSLKVNIEYHIAILILECVSYTKHLILIIFTLNILKYRVSKRLKYRILHYHVITKSKLMRNPPCMMVSWQSYSIFSHNSFTSWSMSSYKHIFMSFETMYGLLLKCIQIKRILKQIIWSKSLHHIYNVVPGEPY